MNRQVTFSTRFRRSAVTLTSIAALSILGGCTTSVTNPLSPVATATSQADAVGEAARYAKLYKQRPGDLATGFRFASALQSIGSNDRAIEVLGEVANNNLDNRDAISAYGKALAEAGRGAEANQVLARAEQLGEPDWKLHSARGLAYDQASEYGPAQAEYEKAARLAPQEPTIFNNWGVSHALAGDLDAAEAMLVKAANLQGADQKVRANLALVLGLQGKFAEAEKVSAMDLPPDAARANIAYLREMLK
ncbi:MAG: tetratricopeptide repeat protein, partial [Rhizobiales bacterium]|nr:tetratricopeptide repeat protein [Hyphomicrobiales bacterium]